jgi:uncharacterized protein with von Willebrand factor type A (vWA) domain
LTVTSAALAFERELRKAGLAVGTAESVDFLRSLTVLDIGVRADVRSASRAVHVRRFENIATHDAVFDEFWSQSTVLAGSAESPRLTHGAGNGDEAETELQLVVSRTYSPDERLRHRDFDLMSPQELAQAEKLVDRLAMGLAERRARRFELHAHGTRLAPRPMMRRSVSTGGELTEWLWRRPRIEPRPIVLLIDISGSMETYARVMLRFAHALVRANRRTEVFVFGTRLTRVTRALATRNVDDALARVSADVADWSGGTRIGDCLREYNKRWAGRIGSSDSITVVLSDGWDRGDPALVAAETQRLRRNSRRLLWLNPLAGAADFEPLAAGMAAAVRHVDRLLPAGSLADLESFARLLADTHWGAQPARTNAFSSSTA